MSLNVGAFETRALGDNGGLGDVNKNGMVNSVDALITLQNAAGLNILESDEFSGNLSKWNSVSGNWLIEDGVLKQKNLELGMLLLNDVQASNQTVKVDFNVMDGGYAGVVLWYESPQNYIMIKAYPDNDSVQMEEVIEGVTYYTGNRRTFDSDKWYQLKVVADVAGTISIYFNNTKVVRNISTGIRTGSTGIIVSNGCLDNFGLLAQ